MIGARRRALGVLAGHVAFAGAVTLAATPIVLALEPALRPAVVRLAGALVLGVALLQLRLAAGRFVAAQPAPPPEPAAAAAGAEAATDKRFRDCLEEIRFGSAREGYWRRVLQPHLAALAERRPGGGPLPEPARSPARRLLRRGPSLAALREVIGRLGAGR